MADYLLQEDGSSKFILEDASGDVLLESSSTGVDPSFIASATTVYAVQVALTDSFTLSAAGTYAWACPPGVTTVEVQCYGGGGGGASGGFAASPGGGGGGGAYAGRLSVPVTPGTVYTIVVGAAGAVNGGTGGDTTFTADSGVQVIAKGATGASGGTGGTAGQASGSTGDTGLKFSGGDGGAGTPGAGDGGGGGGASGNPVATGAAGGTSGAGAGFSGAGGVGSNGGGSGGNGGVYPAGPAVQTGSSPGGGGGGGHGDPGGGAESGATGAAGRVQLTTLTTFTVPFIGSATVVYEAITNPQQITPSFIASATVVYAPTIPAQVTPSFIASATVVYTPSLPEVNVSFISSETRVYRIFSTFDPNLTFGGPGNGGESFAIRLAVNGGGSTATLAGSITAGAHAMLLTGDSGLPTDSPFVVTLDSEVILVSQITAGSYQIRLRALSNTVAAAHTVGSTVSWSDSYDQAITAAADIAHNFTADINSQGSHTYPGWLVCFDATQAYLSGARYPMHVTELIGVFDAGTGSSGTNRLDASQPNSISTATGTSDDCPASLSNPARIQTDIAAGDVGVVRYTNPEGSELDLGPRSVALQSWFGLKRVSTTDSDITFTDPNGIVIDTTGTYDTFTGSINGEFHNPSAIGIGPDTGTPTPNPVPWTSVTLPGADRFFTRGSGGGGYDEKGWPFGVLTVRQGNRRVPFWQSYDWHDFSFVYNGFGTDCTFAQIVVNRNGVANNEPEVALPGPQDIDGPDAVWDDGSYYFGVSWYVAIFNGPYLVIGPSIGGGGGPTNPGGGGSPAYVPGVTFPPGGPPDITPPSPPPVEGGSGGDITPGVAGLHVWQTS